MRGGGRGVNSARREAGEEAEERGWEWEPPPTVVVAVAASLSGLDLLPLPPPQIALLPPFPSSQISNLLFLRRPPTPSAASLTPSSSEPQFRLASIRLFISLAGPRRSSPMIPSQFSVVLGEGFDEVGIEGERGRGEGVKGRVLAEEGEEVGEGEEGESCRRSSEKAKMRSGFRRWERR